ATASPARTPTAPIPRRKWRPPEHIMTPLKNIKVLDFSKVLAGPLCAQHLGELGADVIKVEPPGVGDDTRSWLPQDKGESAIFLSINHNKRSLALDLKSPEGIAIAHR